MILDEIIRYKRKELETRKADIPLKILTTAIWSLPLPLSFKDALLPAQDGRTRVIAEIKKASPSKGVIREDFDYLEIAETYEKNGASALSVLTDRNFFQGSIDYLSEIRHHVSIPLLRKDFVFDEYQIFEARGYGADAVLLIAAVLNEKELHDFVELAFNLGMAPLVEVHDEAELERTLKTRAELIGINNRNLQTFKTDLNTTVRLIDGIPDDKIVISESGINTKNDITLLKDAGVDAFLIGETLMRAVDIGKRLREFVYEGTVPDLRT
ncbi:MAG: indole-3-glycerol phosphate synthase TrpC [Deltaproteobacteria bacterium]